jgi:epimerase EvaD
MSYMVTASYVPEHELAISVTDPALGLPIPENITPVYSERDTVAPTLAEAAEQGLLPRYEVSTQLEQQWREV